MRSWQIRVRFVNGPAADMIETVNGEGGWWCAPAPRLLYWPVLPAPADILADLPGIDTVIDLKTAIYQPVAGYTWRGRHRILRPVRLGETYLYRTDFPDPGCVTGARQVDSGTQLGRATRLPAQTGARP